MENSKATRFWAQPGAGSHSGNWIASKLMVVHCKGGYRSSIATSILRRAGFRDIANLTGGFEAAGVEPDIAGLRRAFKSRCAKDRFGRYITSGGNKFAGLAEDVQTRALAVKLAKRRRRRSTSRSSIERALPRPGAVTRGPRPSAPESRKAGRARGPDRPR